MLSRTTTTFCKVLLRVESWNLGVVLSFPERDRHSTLRAIDRAGQRRAVCGELAGEGPRLRVGKLEVHATVFHREVAQRLVDRRGDSAAECLQVGAVQLSLH